jgi:serine protease
MSAALAAMVLAFSPAPASAGGGAKSASRGFDQFIVRFKDGSAPRVDAQARQRLLDAGTRGRAHAQRRNRLSNGADVVKLDTRLDRAAAAEFMNALRSDPSVDYVEVDRILKPTAFPNDPLFYPNPANNNYSGQWHYNEATGGINLLAAWDLQATGSGVVVAVIDTGITPHSDLDANIVPGYDFKIEDIDGQPGRDADPTDPGDAVTAGECGVGEPAESSSWHGTHVAGTIAAVTNNGKGVAGVAYNAKVMPLRVLGKCGGSTSDIAEAIRWAAGGTVTGVASNPNPVEVINLSLGGEGACGSTTQQAINYAALTKNVVVVVSAGNDNKDAALYEPANCRNVVVVGATERAGAKAPYSNFGPTLDVSAPGGGNGAYVYSTYNKGTTTIGAEGYAGYTGTSMAAPHVAGTAALMQSVAVNTSATIEAVLKSTSRALPVPCAEGCGSGIIDAAKAVGAVATGRLTIGDVSAYEGGGATNFTFTVSLSKAMGADVGFDISTGAGVAAPGVGVATAGVDFNGLNLVGQVIPAGSTSKTFTVTVNGDAAVELDENFVVNVTNVSNIEVARSQAVGTIFNDDATPLSNGVAVAGISEATKQSLLYAIEVPAGRTSLVVTTSGGTGDTDMYVRRGALPTTEPVADCVSDGPATTETCSFSGATAPAAGTWYVMLYGYASVSGVTLTATYTPSSSPTISIGDASVMEGNGGTKQLSFPVNLAAPTSSPVTFDVNTQPGSAAPGSDYVELSVPVTIPAGASGTTVNVTINGDAAVEDNETFVVELSNIAGATAGDLQAQGRINNDDAAQLRIADATMVEGNSGARSMVFEVLLSQAMPSPVTFNVATSNGSAVGGSDYTARTDIGRYLDAGRTRQVFEVPVLGDTTAEGHETFTVTLSGVSGAVLVGASATGTILNDDAGGASTGGAARISSVSSAPVLVLGMDGSLVSADGAAPACRPAGQRRGRLEKALPTCTKEQAEALAKRSR